MAGDTSITVESTPNPRAKKFVLSQPLTGGERRSYYKPEDAAGDPLARELFTIEGVVGVMILADFCSVSVDDAKRWRAVTPKVKRVLKSATET